MSTNEKPSKRSRFGFMVPGAIAGLILIANLAPIGGGSMRGVYVWIAAVVIGAALGATCDLFRR